jgi:hypothetical protein
MTVAAAVDAALSGEAQVYGLLQAFDEDIRQASCAGEEAERRAQQRRDEAVWEAEQRAEETAQAAVQAAIEACVDVVLRAVAVDAMATWRNRPDGQRSADSRKRRRKASKAKARKQRAAGEQHSAEPEADGDGETEEANSALKAALKRERALQSALTDVQKLLRLARRQKRRETKTARQRGQQEARRDSKAKKAATRKRGQKLERALAHAARRERARTDKGQPRPAGEALHTGERVQARKQQQSELRRRLDAHKQGRQQAAR